MLTPAALVVGATGGIGQAISTTLLHAGYDLSVTGRRADEVTSLASELESTGAVEPLVGDLTGANVPAELVSAHLARFGRLDTLVLAAGATTRRLLADTDISRLGTVIDVNLTATVALIAAALPAMRASAGTRPGALVILLSSVVAVRPLPGFAVYSALKAAVSSLARSVNEEENENGIRASAICPGYVDTSFTDALDKGTGDFLPATDIAEAVRFLVSISPGARVPTLEITRTTAEDGRP